MICRGYTRQTGDRLGTGVWGRVVWHSPQINVVCAATWQPRQSDGKDRLYSCCRRLWEGMVPSGRHEMKQHGAQLLL